MSEPSRPHRLPWILGILLLAASAVGAGWALNNGQNSTPSTPSAERKPGLAPPSIVCIGMADTPNGVVQLYPTQSGRVIKVVAEGMQAKKNDVLLQLDPRFAEYRQREAKAALDAAKAQLEQAKSLPDQHASKIKQQEAAVAAAKSLKSAADRELKIKKDLLEVTSSNTNMTAYQAQEDMVKALQAKTEAEENKLGELKLYDPYVDLKRAEADVMAKEALVDQAELAVKECKVLAPEDGLVLRVQVNVGEILGPSPRQAAIQFAPRGPRVVRAEVLQEWGRWVAKDQDVIIEDDTYAATQWKGKIIRVSEWYTQKPTKILEPFYVNDVRTMECLVEVTEGDTPLRIGQRVRVIIKPKS